MKNFLPHLIVVFGGFSVSTSGFSKSKKGYHCEVKKDGKHKDLDKSETPDRKTCKAKGGKWVKEHDHDHGDEGSDHEHAE